MHCCPQGGHRPTCAPLGVSAKDLSQRKVGVTVGPEACSALPGGTATEPNPDLSSAQKLKTKKKETPLPADLSPGAHPPPGRCSHVPHTMKDSPSL